MKNIPIFTTDYGVASLVLKEIPYRGTAYIRVQDATQENLGALIEECAGFCRACGAQTVYWTAENAQAQPDLSVLEMRGTARVEPEKLASLFPVTEQTASRWRQIYNERMSGVDLAAILESRDEEKLIQSLGAYFVHDNGELLGIGWMEDTSLLAIASVCLGAGERVAHTLMSLVEGADVSLEVASTNERAIRLYESLGFIRTRVITKWYRYKNIT